jgi:protein CLEC16A
MLKKAFGGFWKPKNPHSLDHLKYLYSVLSKNQTVTEGNKGLLVETLRGIAEILIWGDQNDSSVFDFFLERNMLSFFLKIMDQKISNNYVCVQLLQTLNILFENIRNETSIYYLLSNNHVNSIIIHKFDFSDEEVMAYYISFLKTLSFRLNKHTIHFFYNEHTNDFPLYTEAIKFFNHSESMVRIAVRTLSLNVYKVEDEAMVQFVTDKTAAPYFSNLVWFIGNHILEIDNCVRNDADHKSLNRLKDIVADHIDHLHYINDILGLKIASLNRILSDHLLNRLFIPLYIYSFARSHIPTEDMRPSVSPVVALFLLCQVFLIITHVPLVRLLAWIIVAGDMEVFTERGATLYATSPRRGGRTKPSFMAPPDSLDRLLAQTIGAHDLPDEDSDVEDAPISSSVAELTQLPPSSSHLPQGARLSSEERMSSEEPGADPTSLSITDEEKEQRLAASSNPALSFTLDNRPFLAALLAALDYTDNDYYQLFALCLIYAMQSNKGINRELLESVGIPPGHAPSPSPGYNKLLVEKMIKLATAGCQYGSRVRLVTLEILIISLKMIVRRGEESVMLDEHFAELEGAREESTLILRNFYKSEEIFLDMFEDEWREMNKRPINVGYVMSDASLLLPPTGTS